MQITEHIGQFASASELLRLADPQSDEMARSIAALESQFLPRKLIACRDVSKQASGPLDRLFAGKRAPELTKSFFFNVALAWIPH